MLNFLFALLAAAPILDKWASLLLRSYRRWCAERDEAEIKAAFDRAQAAQDTRSLQDEINERL